MELEELEATVKIPCLNGRLDDAQRHLVQQYKARYRKMRMWYQMRRDQIKEQCDRLRKEANELSNVKLTAKFELPTQCIEKRRFSLLPEWERDLILAAIAERERLRDEISRIQEEGEQELVQLRDQYREFNDTALARKFGVSAWTIQTL